MPITQAIILCGGKGTRLGELARDVPKPMVPVGGVCVLDHILTCLKAGGVTRFVLLAGHLGRVIAEHYANAPLAGCEMEVVIEAEPRGTAGALSAVADRLDEDFVVTYGDVFIDFDVRALTLTHERHRPVATLLVRASDHPWDSHLVVADDDGRVLEFGHRKEAGRLYRNVANAGVTVMSRRVIDFIPSDRASDFGADIFPALIAAGERLSAHRLEESGFVKDMGTPGRLAEVETYLAERALAENARKTRRPTTTVFVDRDGVLNEDSGWIDHPDRLVLLPGAAEAVALLNAHGIQCVVITNQPAIARGLCDVDVLERIHKKLTDEIASAGGRLARIFFCPHHPETHHADGVRELRRGCRCRKPAPGLIFQAARELGIDLSAAVMVGDRATDIRAGQAAGLPTVLVGDAEIRARETRWARPDAECDSLLALAKKITDGLRRDS